MGGGPRFAAPNWVWSPAGGWWHSPKNWQRNFGIGFGMAMGIVIVMGAYGTSIEKRPMVQDFSPPGLWRRRGVDVNDINH